MQSTIRFKRAICFCNKRIKKRFQCDWFQVIPLDDYINSDVNTNHFPFILEFKVDNDDIKKISHEDFLDEEDSKFFSEINHENNIQNYILKLLSIVTNHYFFVYDVNDLGWFINLDGKKEEDFFCKYGVKLYVDEKQKEKPFIIQFTDTKLPKMDIEEHSHYYTHPDIDNEEQDELTISVQTGAFFASLSDLNTEQKIFFDSAVTLIYNGLDIRKKMKSLAFLAFISSIETMTSLEFKLNKEKIEFECKSCKSIKESNYHCKSCNKPIWGISQQIKKYLEKYLSDSDEFKTVINKLYSRRSKIAHTGGLLSGDIFFEWNEPKKREEHYMELVSAMQYSRMSLVNYVLKNSKK
jgi:hypothetical protein